MHRQSTRTIPSLLTLASAALLSACGDTGSGTSSATTGGSSPDYYSPAVASGGAATDGLGAPVGMGGASSTPTSGGAPSISSSGGAVDAIATGGVPVVPLVPTPPVDGLTPVQRWGQLRVDGTQLVDAAGSPVQLKGVSSMWLNWETDGYAESLEGVRWLRDNWRLSVIRAAMGVEPSGAYMDNPEKAKGQVRNIVDNAIELGIYVIIDWHDHEAELRQADAQAFFQEMAEEYGSTPNVLYETFNEPLRVSWTDVLKPYHESVVASIRAVDSDNVIILGTPNWSQYVDEASRNPVVGTNLMYTMHFYSCSHKASLRSKGDTAIAAGLALFVTEWGATHSDGGTDGLVCLDDAQAWHDWMDTKGISWTAWKFDNCSDSTCYFPPRGPSVDGGWTDADFQGHALFVRDRIID